MPTKFLGIGLSYNDETEWQLDHETVSGEMLNKFILADLAPARVPINEKDGDTEGALFWSVKRITSRPSIQKVFIGQFAVDCSVQTT